MLGNTRKILLHGGGKLDSVGTEVDNILRDRKTLLFIPYARPGGVTWEEYTDKVKEDLPKRGITLQIRGINEYNDHKDAVRGAEAVLIGGGNSFVLLKSLWEQEIVETIRMKVSEGMPYLGISAGANVAGMTIMTTNDMPIVYPPTFTGIRLVPFVLNPHYTPIVSIPNVGEGRQERINEYLAFNQEPVLALQDNTALSIVNNKATVVGHGSATVFSKEGVRSYEPGSEIDSLLRS